MCSILTGLRVLEVPFFGILGGDKSLLTLEVPSFVGVQINVPVGRAPLPELLARGLVLRFGGANEPDKTKRDCT